MGIQEAWVLEALATTSYVFPGKSFSLAGPYLPYLCHEVLDWMDYQCSLTSVIIIITLTMCLALL